MIAPADLTRERLLALRNEADRLGRECSLALDVETDGAETIDMDPEDL